jgi:eukaryotic-like serine/threonine-protein kinase
MAPEQAQGRTVDRRVDIWAFGCVVFEMLAGRRAFPGETVTDVFASVLAREPDWKALPSQTPESIHRLLRRCLQKDPKRRLREIGDACLELDDALEAPPPMAKSRGATPRWVLVLGTLLIASLGATLLWLAMTREPARAVVRTQRLTDMIGLEETPALSPDGRSLAFTAGVNGRRQVFIQLLNGGEPLQITHDDTDHLFPRWTQSSGSVVYFSPATPGGSQGTLWEISALGGPPRKLASSLGAGDVGGSDSLLTYFRNSQGKPELVTAPLDGSSITVVASFDLDREYLYPRWSPDGKWLAYQEGTALSWDIHIVPAGGGKPRQLTNDGRHINGFAWLPDSSGLLYSSTRGETMAYLAHRAAVARCARGWGCAGDFGRGLVRAA